MTLFYDDDVDVTQDRPMSHSADYDALVALADELDARCPARINGQVVACQDGHSHGCAVLPTEVAARIRACLIPPGQETT